jgi:hypothetical protein
MVLFQVSVKQMHCAVSEIPGVDIYLHVYHEYGRGAPRRTKTRSTFHYLDSVKRPKCYRTVAYRAILVEYLRYVKNAGLYCSYLELSTHTPERLHLFYSHPTSNQLISPHEMLGQVSSDVGDVGPKVL